jgi:5-methylcytosine-specific restriction protein B
MELTDNSTLDELNNIFRNKIIPLLQEYFYDDWEKIQMVLGEGFIEKKEISDDIFKYKIEDYLEENKFIFSIKDDFDYSEI